MMLFNGSRSVRVGASSGHPKVMVATGNTNEGNFKVSMISCGI